LALAQIAALGYAIALILGYHIGDWQPTFFALFFAMVGSLLFAFAQPLEKKMPLEAVIGIGYVFAAALAVLILSFSSSGTEDFEKLAMGNILVVSWNDIIKMAVIYVLVGAFHWIFRKKFLEATFDHAVSGAKSWHFLFYFSLGIVVTYSIAVAGVLLVFSYLVIPAVLALIFCDNIRTRLIFGWVLGFLTSAAGLYISFAFDLPTAATITTCFGLIFIISALIGGKIGKYNV
jgi:zinc/manganese transport system permease protein